MEYVMRSGSFTHISVRLHCMSRSISRTRLPLRWIPCAKLNEIVDFPTPPLMLSMDTTFATRNPPHQTYPSIRSDLHFPMGFDVCRGFPSLVQRKAPALPGLQDLAPSGQLVFVVGPLAHSDVVFP